MQPQKAPDLHINASPIQVNDQMMVQIVIADNFGIGITLVWPQDMVRSFSKALKTAVEQAEVAVIKPPSLLAQA